MPRCLLLAIALALLIGCKKKLPESSEPSDSVAPQPQAREAGVASEWVVNDDVAVRIEKVRIQKPTIEVKEAKSETPTTKELDQPELMVWVSFENRSSTRRINYPGWDIIFDPEREPSLVDEHGNKYRRLSHTRVDIAKLKTEHLKGQVDQKTIDPGDKLLTDIICFEKPIATATKLTLRVPHLEARKKAATFEIPAAAWAGAGKAVAVNDETPALKPKEVVEPKVEGKFVGLNEWSRVGDVQVRIKKGKVMKAPLKSPTGREGVTKEPHLVLVIDVQNLSKTRKLEYFRWGTLPGANASSSIADEHGNKYTIRDHDDFEWEDRFKTIQPEGPIHEDMILIEQPVAPATELRMVFPSFVSGETEKHRFKIPSSAWK